jgi:ribonuclease M5
MIKEVIIVEGRDDEAAVKNAVEAEIIVTHGFGIKKETMEIIKKAYENVGIIIFTDPDYAGEKIRERLTKAFPLAKQAYLPRAQATKDGNVGVENGRAQDIITALSKVRTISYEKRVEFIHDDMINYGIIGDKESKSKREFLGKELGIGYGNGKVFINRLNNYGVTRKEFLQAWINYTHHLQSIK